MKKSVLMLLLILSSFGVRAADGDLFPYPVPPADMEVLQDRCDYLLTHFWDRCDFKTAFSKTDKLKDCFGDWVSFMPYASADTVYATIDRLLAKVAKSGPQTLALARMAEEFTYSDTADIFSEEIYYPFAKAVVNHKKISNADKARFQWQVQVIDNTRTGGIMNHLDFEMPDGTKGSLNGIATQMILVMFSDHDCDDCTLARVRLSADLNTNFLIKNGLLTVLCIEPNEVTTEWLVAVASYPDNWVKGASADAQDYFDLRTYPTFFLLDSRHKVLAKDFDIDGLLSAMYRLRQGTGM